MPRIFKTVAQDQDEDAAQRTAHCRSFTGDVAAAQDRASESFEFHTQANSRLRCHIPGGQQAGRNARGQTGIRVSQDLV